MDRASDSGSEGWGFESLPVYQTNKRDTRSGIPLICFALRAERTRTIKSDLPVAGRASPVSTAMHPCHVPQVHGQRVPSGIVKRGESLDFGMWNKSK